MAKVNLRSFDYAKVAQIDAEMWRSYYNHEFYKLFWQMLKLLKNQLGLSWFKTLRLAFYSSWAAADYRINKGNTNNVRIERNLIKFYKLISKNAVEEFDYAKAGHFELAWWEIHRSSNKNSNKLNKSLAAAAAAMFNENPEKLYKYARHRAEAMFLPAHASDEVSQTDWSKVNELLSISWRELFDSVQKH